MSAKNEIISVENNLTKKLYILISKTLNFQQFLVNFALLTIVFVIFLSVCEVVNNFSKKDALCLYSFIAESFKSQIFLFKF